MKRVLIVASTRIHIMNFHLPYIRDFKARGWEVTVACGSCSEAIPDADRSLALPFEKKMSSPANFRAMAMLRREICETSYELMICHTSLAAFFARAALFGVRKRPAVCNMVHGYLFDDDSSAAKKLLLASAEKFTAPMTDLIITMNRFDTEYAAKHRLAKRVEAVKGIGLYPKEIQNTKTALREELGFSDKEFLLLYAAEFSKRKSQRVLIEAMSRLPDKVVLLLPGNGVLLEECKQLTKALGIEKRVVFPGYIKNVAEWYQAADAAISASRSEGLPFNILEAMHYGLPVVASSVKGHTDLIEDGVNGLLYPYGDAAACADRIERILSDAQFRKSLSDSAGERIHGYYLGNVMPGVMELYLSTLE